MKENLWSSGNAFISTLGYKYESIGGDSWGDQYSGAEKEFDKIIDKVIKENGLHNITRNKHYDSPPFWEWISIQNSNRIISQLALLEHENLLNSSSNIYEIFEEVFYGNGNEHNIENITGADWRLEILDHKGEAYTSSLLDLDKMEFVFGINLPVETKMIQEVLLNAELEGKTGTIRDILGNNYISKEQRDDLYFALFGEKIPAPGRYDITDTKNVAQFMENSGIKSWTEAERKLIDEYYNTLPIITQDNINQARYKYVILSIMREMSKSREEKSDERKILEQKALEGIDQINNLEEQVESLESRNNSLDIQLSKDSNTNTKNNEQNRE